ncbi:MAG: GAF domain-containing protein, partial [Acidobacteriaceae bacterium]|nr:GAF domain-containing protein [Acidobacteriaceae bacterium]
MNRVPQTGTSDVQLKLQSLTETAQLLTRGDAAAIVLGDQSTMICHASAGEHAPVLGCRLDVSQGFSGECIRSRKALRCENIDGDTRVDAAICRRLGIRSILAAPIWLDGKIVGLLEVFSSRRFAFHDGDLVVVQELAESALRPAASKPVPAPKLLFELEPRYRVFWENLTELVRPPRLAPLNLTSRPARFWPDVFVPSQLPWQRFGHSILLHGTALVLLLAFLRVGMSQPRLVTKSSFSQSDVIYYAPSEYAATTTRKAASSAASARPTAARANILQASAEQPAIPVRRGSTRSSPQQADVQPPKLSLKGNLRLVRLIGGTTALPVAPMSATTRTEVATPTLGIAAIAPPPELGGLSRNRLPTSGMPHVVQPAPSVAGAIHDRGTINIGQLQAVAPAPDLPLHNHGLTLSAMRSTLGGGSAGIVPPAPSVKGIGRSGVGALEGAGRMQVVPPAPAVQIAKSLGSGGVGRGVMAVVPPPPSVGGLGSTGAHASSVTSASSQVVPPAPAVQMARSYAAGVLGGGTVDAVPPSPSVAGLGRADAARGGSFSGSAHVVPPA